MPVNPTLVPSFRYTNAINDSDAHPNVVKALRSISKSITDLNSAIPALRKTVITESVIKVQGGGSSGGGSAGILPVSEPALPNVWIDSYDAATGLFTQAPLPNSGVTPGSYTNTNLTVDAKGIVTAASDGSAAGNTKIPHDVTGSRALTGIYQNTTGDDMYISGYCTTSGGGTGALSARIGPVTSGQEVWANDYTATLASGRAGFQFWVPNGYFYELLVIPSTGTAITGLGLWIEFY